ncbi:replication-relaxation family protein [Kitasatospora sp. NPDC088548]|uniref:replication-relaxation family protein n=1 Tax=Kitasatospora sp. NPDC088548 TaxID=3364075 RepID=UPI00381F4A38
MTTAPATTADFSRLALCALFQHRMATTHQLHVLISPNVSIQWVRRRLADLYGRGLVGRVDMPGPGRNLVWYLTDQGRSTTEVLPEVQGRTCPPAPADPFAARMRTGHTLDVLRAHVAFLEDARARGDEYGPLDWLPEINHRIAERSAESLTADALMQYATSGPGRTLHRAFVEVDRATMVSERLASKLMAYARFHALTPVPGHHRGTSHALDALPSWQHHYLRFPRLLFVLTGSGKAALRQRERDLQLVAADNPLVARMLQSVKAGAALLEDIEKQGASAPVWTPLVNPDGGPRSWMDL